jgi:hypothetical protein
MRHPVMSDAKKNRAGEGTAMHSAQICQYLALFGFLDHNMS